MRHLLSVVFLVVAGSVVVACSEEMKFVGEGGGGAGGGDAGGGGTGGGGSCNPDACDPGGECQVATCTAAACGLASAPEGSPCGVDGKLTCAAGQCQGCTSPDQCTSAECNDTLCTAGTCELVPNTGLSCTSGNGVCSPDGKCQSCDDGVKSGDETDLDCGGVCGSTCGNGSTCAINGDCVSGLCVNGLCCNEACEGACNTCAGVGHLGLCLPVAPGQSDAQCQGTDVCDGAGACAKAAAQPCAEASECASHLCKGSPKACAACSASTDCAAGEVCIAGACFAKGDKGASCQGDLACTSGFCVDGVCCESACTGLCMACHFNLTAKSPGDCDPIIGPGQGFNGFYDPHAECSPAPAGGGYCSGGPANAAGDSSCGGMP